MAGLLRVAEGWSKEHRIRLEKAYVLVSELHSGDRHRSNPYVYHLLRVAGRIPGYLHVYDPELITAALLHDSVEDHPEGIVETFDKNFIQSQDAELLQRQALECLASEFSPRTSRIVAAVTNPVSLSAEGLSYEDRLSAYADKVIEAVQTPEGWMLKFSDWCDNGVGIIHSEKQADVKRKQHFKRKYGQVTGAFRQRFMDADIQELLDEEAKRYVRQQLSLAGERLRPEGKQ